MGSQFAYTAHSCSRAFTCCRNKLYNLSIFITRVRPRRRQCALLFLSRSFCVIVCKPAAEQRARWSSSRFYVNTHLKSPRCLYLYCNKASFARLFYSYTKCKTINSPRGEIPALLSAEQMYVVHTAHTRGHTHKAHSCVLCTLYAETHTNVSGAAAALKPNFDKV